MMLDYHRTTEEEKYIISDWKYKGKYALYNRASYEEDKKTGRGFANTKNNFFSFVDGEKLVGFTNLVEEEREVFVGIGANPVYCNQGYGQKMLKQTYDLSKLLFPDKPLCLKVRTWNKRAVRCYEKAGFRIDRDPFKETTPIGEGVFYRMVKE